MRISQTNRSFLWLRLGLAAVLTAFLSAFLALTLKHMTEYYEGVVFAKTERYRFILLFLPFIGLSVIYFLRKYLFKNKENKGIREVFESRDSGKPLPAYKIPSHFINGLLTVSFGGSTGIEVSTVVSTAAIGSLASTKESILRKYKKELLCAGTAAGITILFSSPIAGLLFVYEVIYRKFSRAFAFTVGLGVTVAALCSFFMDEKPLFEIVVRPWHYQALPYFVLLGALAGLHSVYLTKSVLYFKKRFSVISPVFNKVAVGAVLTGLLILIFPELYGDGYHALESLILSDGNVSGFAALFGLFAIMLLKPIATSLTLSAGGDGGVFAPGIFIGGFLGIITAIVSNTYFGTELIVLNFMAVGMASVLSASINAPFTALFLVCGIIGDYSLIVPLSIGSFVSRFTARSIFPFTVYNYK